MRKNIFLLLFALFSFSAIHAEIDWKRENGTLTISGTGDMPNYNSPADVPWYNDQKKIKKVVINDGVTSIGECAFSCCESLTSITIPNSVTSIGNYAFEYCSSLTSITIPNSVTSIGKRAFYDCSGLATITVEKGNTKYDSRDNCNAIIETNTNKLIAGCKNTTIPNSVTSIEESAFYGCSGLTSITIPNSVTSIGNHAFDGCSGLTSITFERTTPPQIEYAVFDGVNKSIPIYVPANSREAYKKALGGFGFSNIQAIPPVTLMDYVVYAQSSQIDGMDIYYTRSFANTNWQALYLPFSLNYEDWKDDFEVAYINTVRQYDDNGDGRADRTIMEAVKKNSGSTAPNTPYLIRAKTAGEKTFFVENATLYPAENNSVDCSTTTARFTFTGIYKEKSFGLSASNYYAINEGRLTALSAWLPVPPYRWYMSVRTRSSVYDTSGWGWAKEISISVVGEEETTGVADIQHLSPDTQIFDINGRKVSENDLKPGIYVKNGKKFVVR